MLDRRLLAAAALAAALLLTPTPATAQDEPLVGYGPDGFFAQSEDGRYRIEIGGQLQPRFDFARDDGGEGGDDHTRAAFMIRRARTEISGNVFSEAVEYKFQVDWSRGFPTLKDGFIDFILEPEWFALRVGQFKVPTSRQFLSSSKRLELVDRSIATEAFRPERDLGLSVHNTRKNFFEYELGLFNGSSDRARFSGTVALDPIQSEASISGGRFSNVPETFRPLFAARVGINSMGSDAYAEADLNGARGRADGFRYAIGASGFTELDVDQNDQISSGVSGDFVMKIAGFNLSAMAFYRHDVLDTEAPEDDEGAFDALVGGMAQLGYTFAATADTQVQPVLRYSAVAPSRDSSLSPTSHEAGGGVNVYFSGHRLKLQADAWALIDEPPAATGMETTVDALVRAQIQLIF